MKKHQLLPVLLLFFVSLGCRKNGDHPGGGGGSGGGTGGGSGGTGGNHAPKRWLIKSAVSYYDATHFQHTVFTYDTALRITRVGYGLSVLADTFDLSAQRWTDYVYDKDGKLVTAKPNQGPGLSFSYLSAFSIQVKADPFDVGHDGTSTFNFNANGNKELDQIKSFIPPGNLLSGSTGSDFFYNALGGIQSQNDLQNDGSLQVLWAALTASSAVPLSNPFSNGTTIEQRLIYFRSQIFGAYDELGPKWSNNTFESYNYATGVKTPYTHFWNAYTVNADTNVTSVTQSYVLLSDPQQTVLKIHPVFISYEQH